MEDLDEFECPLEHIDDYALYLEWIENGQMDCSLFYQDGECVGFAGVYDAVWGTTVVLLPGANLENGLGFYRTVRDLKDQILATGVTLYCHNKIGSISSRMVPNMGFELDYVVQTETDTILRWRSLEWKGS